MSEKVSLEVGTDDDKKVLEVEKPVAEMSKTVKDMLADLGGDNAIPLPNVSPNVRGNDMTGRPTATDRRVRDR